MVKENLDRHEEPRISRRGLLGALVGGTTLLALEACGAGGNTAVPAGDKKTSAPTLQPWQLSPDKQQAYNSADVLSQTRLDISARYTTAIEGIAGSDLGDINKLPTDAQMTYAAAMVDLNLPVGVHDYNESTLPIVTSAHMDLQKAYADYDIKTPMERLLPAVNVRFSAMMEAYDPTVPDVGTFVLETYANPALGFVQTLQSNMEKRINVPVASEVIAATGVLPAGVYDINGTQVTIVGEGRIYGAQDIETTNNMPFWFGVLDAVPYTDERTGKTERIIRSTSIIGTTNANEVHMAIDKYQKK